MIKLLNHFHPLEKIKRSRSKYLEITEMPDFLSDLIGQEVPDLAVRSNTLDYIVLDLETTGLDSEKDIMLSMGWLEMSQGRIDLNTAQHLYLNDDLNVKAETAVINHITPQMLAEGVSIKEAMTAFLKAAKGKILVAHGCMVEMNFINHYLSGAYGIKEPPLIWLDTLQIEKKLQNSVSRENSNDFTLSGTRARYKLPEYNGHNALADAISTAELLLVQQKRIAPRASATLGQLYRRSFD